MLFGSCILLLFTGNLGEWVKIPVLDPEKETTELIDQSYPTDFPSHQSINTSSYRTSSSVKSDNQFQKRMGELKKNEGLDENLLDANTNITIDNFIQSVMNNSQSGSNEMNHSPENSFFSSDILKNIHRSLLYPTSTSKKGKIIFLENLKQKLYTYIRPHIDLFWDNKERQARMDKGMGFPSMDGALMTISFLLFAVFLIKLVQQLIQQVQDKANAQAMLMSGATPVVATAGGGRRRRDIPSDVYAAAQIFHFIEQFHSKDYT